MANRQRRQHRGGAIGVCAYLNTKLNVDKFEKKEPFFFGSSQSASSSFMCIGVTSHGNRTAFQSHDRNSYGASNAQAISRRHRRPIATMVKRVVQKQRSAAMLRWCVRVLESQAAC